MTESHHFWAKSPLVFWYKALHLEIPRSAAMSGGIYLWNDGREVPDTMDVTLDQPEQMLVSWSSGFGNNQLGVTEDLLGSNGTISRGKYTFAIRVWYDSMPPAAVVVGVEQKLHGSRPAMTNSG